MAPCPHPDQAPLTLCAVCRMVVPSPAPPAAAKAPRGKKTAGKPRVEMPVELFAPVTFRVEAVPVTQGSMKSLGRGRMAHVNGPQLSAWRTLLAVEARAAGAVSVESTVPVRVEVVFWLPRPASVKRHRPTAKHDLDKLLRAVLDGLTGVCFVDDGQVVETSAAKYYADDDHPVGAAITVTLLHDAPAGLAALAQ